MRRPLFQSAAILAFAAGSALLIALSLAATDGRLIYTLDDPYIHLALAETLLEGGFGVNSDEYASPSSSILYAPLLALALILGLGDAGPLALALAAMAGAVWLLAGALWDAVAEGAEGLPLAGGLAMALALPLAVNAFGLPMTGMEHALHLWASLAVVLGLARSGGAARVPAWLPVAVIACALIRFEGYALALAALAVLAALGHRRAALATGLALGAATALYMAAMAWLGLPLLPSSVLVKSGIAATALEADSGGTLAGVLINVYDSLNNRWGLFLALAGLAALAGGAARDLGPAPRLAALAGLAAMAAHIGFGRYGWFGRYEVYAVGIALAVLALTLRPALSAIRPARLRAALVALALAAIAAPYVGTTAQTPAAARNIYQQQYQMHRFATLYLPGPVAVNDLGYVAYRNPHHVLDLWGLGSETARRLTREAGRTTEALTELTRGVGYAMIYDHWFAGAIPPDWCRLAELRTSRVTAASGVVAFYLVDPGLEAEMRAALARFAPTLPAGARIETADCAAP